MRKNRWTKRELKQASQKNVDIVAIMEALNIDPNKAKIFIDELLAKRDKAPKE